MSYFRFDTLSKPGANSDFFKMSHCILLASVGSHIISELISVCLGMEQAYWLKTERHSAFLGWIPTQSI